jgi:anti-anti-sigma factor
LSVEFRLAYPPLSVTIAVDEERAGWLVECEGEMCTVSVEVIREQLIDCLARSTSGAVTLDLGGITFIDARGLALLVEMHGLARRQRRIFSICRVSGCVARLQSICNLTYINKSDESDRPRPDTALAQS